MYLCNSPFLLADTSDDWGAKIHAQSNITFSLTYICNTYITGTSALPEIHARATGPRALAYIRQSTSAFGISTMPVQDQWMENNQVQLQIFLKR